MIPIVRSARMQVVGIVLSMIAACCGWPSTARADEADGQWEKLFYDSPSGSTPRPLFDPLRNRLLLFGSTTWELSLSGPLMWRRIPAPLGTFPGTSLNVYDPIHDRFLVVVPGWWPDAMHVFELSLAEPMTWSELPVVHSPVLNWFPWAITFSPSTQVARIMNGTSPDIYGGNTLVVDWATQISFSTGSAVFGTLGSSGLGERTGFATALDSVRNRVIAYGGINRTSDFHDVRTAPVGGTFSPASTVGSPPGPTGGSATVDVLRDRMLLFADGSTGPELWQLTLAAPMTWSQLSVPGPWPAKAGSAVYDEAGDRLVSYGAGTNNGLWALSLAEPAWADNSVAVQPPAATAGHVIVRDADSDRMVYMGSDPVGDVWALSLVDPFPWIHLAPSGSAPSARVHESCIYDSARDRMIVFGGRASTFTTVPYGDIWALSLDDSVSWSQLSPVGAPPPARYLHTAVYDPVGDRMLVWGGNGQSGTPLDDLWELTLADPPTWNQIMPSGPAPSYLERPRSVFDSAHRRMVIVGGTSGGDTWALSLDGTPTWTQLPSCDAEFGPVYDPFRNRIVALRSGGGLRELELANPVAWEPMTPTGAGPTLTGYPVLVFDETRNRALVLPYQYASTVYTLSFGSLVDAQRQRPVSGIELAAAVPNPALASTAVRLALPGRRNVSLDVFDIAARRVRRLVDGPLEAGHHSIGWDLRDAGGVRVAPGVYVVALRAGDVRLSRRIVVVR